MGPPRSADVTPHPIVLHLFLLCGLGLFSYRPALPQYSGAALSLAATESCGELHFPIHRQFYLGYSGIIAATIAEISILLICLSVACVVCTALRVHYVSWNLDALPFQRLSTAERVPDRVLALYCCPPLRQSTFTCVVRLSLPTLTADFFPEEPLHMLSGTMYTTAGRDWTASSRKNNNKKEPFMSRDS